MFLFSPLEPKPIQELLNEIVSKLSSLFALFQFPLKINQSLLNEMLVLSENKIFALKDVTTHFYYLSFYVLKILHLALF